LAPEQLGGLYPELASHDQRKGSGAYFTSAALARPTALRTLAPLLTGADPAALRIIDPAVGSGAFLAAALAELQAATGRPAAALVGCLHGVDLDPTAAALAAWSLHRACGDGAPAIAAIEANVRGGDGLLDLPASDFDAVLGNPPWETLQPSSKEYFAELHAGYRALGRVDALVARETTFRNDAAARSDWQQVQAAAAARARALRQHFHQQGRGKLFTYRLFVEQAVRLLRPGGRLGLLLPGALWSDAEAAPLRRLLLEQCRWEWLFGFENRARLFPIDSRYRFGVVIAQRGGRTAAVRCTFQQRDAAVWAQPSPPHLLYPAETVRALSPAHGAFVELGSDRDLAVLATMHDHGQRYLGDGGAFRFAQGDFNMTADAPRFLRVAAAERAGFVRDDDSVWRRGDEALLPLWQGAMVADLQANAGAFAGGAGHRTRWTQPDDPRLPRPQFLVAAATVRQRGELPVARAAFRALSNATNTRTVQTCLLPAVPCGNSLGLLTPVAAGAEPVRECAFAVGVLGSLVFDWALRLRLCGTNLNACVLTETVLPRVDAAQKDAIAALVMQLAAGLPLHAECWQRGRAAGWVVSTVRPVTDAAARRTLAVQLDLLVARAFGLGHAELAWLLRDCGHPSECLRDPEFTRRLDPKGFWRVDRDLAPGQRHPQQLLSAAMPALDRPISVGREQGDEVRAQ
jgi:SAM-dependent methyltransferase